MPGKFSWPALSRYVGVFALGYLLAAGGKGRPPRADPAGYPTKVVITSPGSGPVHDTRTIRVGWATEGGESTEVCRLSADDPPYKVELISRDRRYSLVGHAEK